MITCANPACSNIVPPSKNPGRPRKYCSMRCKARVGASNYYRREAAREAQARPQQQPGETRICASETCTATVPPSKKGGRARIYCSFECQRRQNARRYYRDHYAGDAGGIQRESPDGRPFVYRVVVKKANAAEKAYKSHLLSCENSDDGSGKCPARWDTYDWKRECLIHAVLREDWDELRRWERDHTRWKRVQTTPDGYWIEPAPTMNSVASSSLS